MSSFQTLSHVSAVVGLVQQLVCSATPTRPREYRALGGPTSLLFETRTRVSFLFPRGNPGPLKMSEKKLQAPPFCHADSDCPDCMKCKNQSCKLQEGCCFADWQCPKVGQKCENGSCVEPCAKKCAVGWTCEDENCVPICTTLGEEAFDLKTQQCINNPVRGKTCERNTHECQEECSKWGDKNQAQGYCEYYGCSDENQCSSFYPIVPP